MSQYPIHDELAARAAERHVVQNVIDTLAEKGIELCRYDSEIGRDGEYYPIQEREGALVALLMGLDFKAYNAEKEAMYAELVRS